MELILNNTRVDLKEGIDPTKFMANKAIAANDSEVRQVFVDHGFNLDGINGIFVRTFTVSADELKEIKANLDKIVEMGLTAVFNANLKLSYFRNKFMEKLEYCVKNNLPYLNEDNTFIKAFNNDEDYQAYISKANVTRVKPNPVSAQESQVRSTTRVESRGYANYSRTVATSRPTVPTEPKKEVAPVVNVNSTTETSMSYEDRQVYNEVIERLNFLVLGNPMDQALADTVKSSSEKIAAAIMRQEYKWTSLSEMITNVIFDGLNLKADDIARITELISGAFPDEERKLA